MELKDRQKSILGAVIEAYIRTARPVASQELAREYDLGVSPATIRSELLQLDERGYIEQPHTSAGRIPTDRGYRFFVDHLLSDHALSVREQERINDVFGCTEEERFIKELARAVADISGMFSVAGLEHDDVFYKTGFADILDEPEFGDQEEIRAFAEMADAVDGDIKSIFGMRGREVAGEIFIGRENPWRAARNYSMAFSFWRHPAGFRGFVGMIGPKRMDYRKQKAILKKIKNKE